MKGIETTIGNAYLPVNSLAMIGRLQELIAENKTNCLSDCHNDRRVKAVLWLLMQQVFGQVSIIDMRKVWEDCMRKESVSDDQRRAA